MTKATHERQEVRDEAAAQAREDARLAVKSNARLIVRAPVTFGGRDFRSGDVIPDDDSINGDERKAAIERGDVEPVK